VITGSPSTTCSMTGPFEVMLVNARHVKNLPGRKTDVSDAAWLAQLGAHGLVRGSFVPPEPIRQLRDLTRTRTTITRRTGPRDPAPRETPRGRGHQAVLGGLGYHRGLRTRDARGVDRRRARSPDVWPIWPSGGCVEDPRAHRGPDRALQRPSRFLARFISTSSTTTPAPSTS
jgi:hypothetical protein